MYPNKQTFKSVIIIKLTTAENYGYPFCQINAGELHNFIGGYPPPANYDHRMANFCSAMKDLMQEGDQIILQPPSGQGASITIK